MAGAGLSAVQSASIAVGSVLGLALFAVVVWIVRRRVRGSMMSGTTAQIELGITWRETMGSGASDGKWNSLLGSGSQTQPIETIDPFGYDMGES
jgi:hypothetical protein